MEFEKYINKDPYPKRPKQPLLTDRTAKGHREYADALEIYEKEVAEYNASVEKWQEKTNALTQEFKVDLFEELNITNNPKAELLYSIVWDKGHACGFSDIYNEACDIVDLIR